MAEMLLINPKRRTTKRRPAAHAAKRVHRRRKNPYATMLTNARRRKNSMRKTNPIHSMRRRVMRRRNPMMGGAMMSGYMSLIKEGLIGGAGAVAMDVVYGYVNNMLPDMLKTKPGSVNAGDAVKAIYTVAAGKALSKVTGGLSMKAATASLAIQSYNLVKQFLPATMSLGYASPANIIQGTNRVGPIRQGMNAYVRPGQTPLLSAYQRPDGRSALLNGGGKASKREGVSLYY